MSGLAAAVMVVGSLGSGTARGSAHAVEPRGRVTAHNATTGTAPPATAGLPALVWTEGRLSSRVVHTAEELRNAVVVRVANGTAWLPARRQAPRGMAFPIDVSAAVPRRYAAVVPGVPAVLRGLRPGGVILSRDSARLRRLHVGSRTVLGPLHLRVSGIVPDSVIGDAEMFVTRRDGRRLHLPPNRFLLIQPRGTATWHAIRSRLRRAAAGSPLGLEAPGTERVLHEADPVLTPLEEKLRFGEFAASPHPAAGGYLAISSRWSAHHLLTARVPILGRMTCNRAFIPAVRSALRSVVRHHLQRLINPNDYGGCYAPRLIPGHPGQEISHHAFGSAIDINVRTNLQGDRPHQDRRIVKIFARFGLMWGGRFLIPDGMHFESLGPDTAQPRSR